MTIIETGVHAIHLFVEWEQKKKVTVSHAFYRANLWNVSEVVSMCAGMVSRIVNNIRMITFISHHNHKFLSLCSLSHSPLVSVFNDDKNTAIRTTIGYCQVIWHLFCKYSRCWYYFHHSSWDETHLTRS